MGEELLVLFSEVPNLPCKGALCSQGFSEIRKVSQSVWQSLVPVSKSNSVCVRLKLLEQIASIYIGQEDKKLICRSSQEGRMNTGWVGNNQGDLIKWNRIVNTGRQQRRQGRAASIAAIRQHCYGVEGGMLRVAQPPPQASLFKASLMLLYLPIEQIASRLHAAHQDSHWTPAEFVSQWIVWIFRGRKAAAVGNIRLNLQIRKNQ